MQPKPKFEPGDYVTIHVPGDVDDGKIFQIEKLSPSTQKRRTPHTHEWRYSLIGSEGYFNESQLEFWHSNND